MTQPDLANLLADAKAALGLSYEALSAACGGAPSDKRLHQLINAPLKNFPDPSTIRSLSRGTGVSVKDIVMAAARSLDLAVPDSDPDAVHIQGSRDLPASTQAAFVAMGQELVKLNSRVVTKEVVGNEQHPTHMNQAGESPASPKGKKVPYVDPHAHPDADEYGRVPLPANYYDLAASGHRNLGAEEAARASARGEESQEGLGSID